MLLLEWMEEDLQHRRKVLEISDRRVSLDIDRKLEEVKYLLADLRGSRQQAR